jgi:hypothetical protein
MPELSLAALIKSRGALKARLTKFVSMVDELNQENPNFDQLKMKFEKFKSLESEFDSVQKQIESHVEEDAVDEQVDYREEFENNFIAAAVRVNKILDAAKSETPNGNTHHSNISVTNPNFVPVALPTMSLPSFDGSWEQWLSFYQRFDSLIHSNASLSPIQKFQYLNSCVTGEASSVIKSLGITTENYPIAIALLKERYDDQRLIIKNHIRALFDLPNVTKDSPASLRQLIDKVDLHLKVLKTLDAPTETWDLLIIHLIELKLDAFTMREWETTNKKTMPTLKDMYAYLKDRCRVWEAIQFHKNPEKNRDVQSKSNPQQKSKAPFTRSSSNLATQQPSCKLCNQNHFMYQCKQFLNLSVSARIAEVKRLKLCFNCLRSTSHSASQCKSGVCKICNKMHNSLLHLTEPAAPVTTNAAEDTPIVANHHCHSYESQVLLSTAVILVRDNTGQYQSCRALIDVGSQSNFVTVETCKRLRVNSKETNIRVTGIGNANGSIVNKIASLQVKSFHNAFGANLNCLVVPIITHSVPAESINASLLQIPNNIKLADPQFHRSGPIDILIGAEIFWDLLCVGQIKATKVHPVFQKTHLGWIAGGAMRLPAKLPQNSVTNLHVVTSAVNPLDARIAKFWEIEETPVHKSLTSAERACETHFISTVKRDNVVAILDKGCFPLNKWASNCPELLPTLSENEVMVNFDKHGDSKTLGLLWNCTHDALKYSICQIQSGNRVTKRRILSITAQIFDPLGLVGPVILIAKLMIQSLWSLNVGWDESVPIRILTTWDSFIASLPELNQLEIPRQVTSNQNPIGFELHGFCDASERAYGACIYIRSLNTATPHQTRLLCAKSRVAPLKTITLPRLELCGALLLSKLIASLRQSLNLPIAKTCCWTDSQIVLSWLAAEPATWKTFVANRVSEIQVLTKNCVWSYVNTKDNPADIISRGCSPRELIDSPLWWHGPSWLSNEAQHWPKYCQTNPNFANDQELPEQRRVVAVAITSEKMLPPDFLTRFSSLRKLQRVLSYCLRFAENCRKPITKHTGPLKVSELQRSMLIILKNVQYQAFSTEIKELEGGRQVSKKSRLISLNPFLDDSGLIRVGGRLRNSGAHSDVKHPIVLPKCEITELIIQAEHISLLHAGPQATLASLRQRYWPMSGRSVVRRIIHNCLKCFRANPTTSSQLMGDLPKDRVQPARPFLNSGVDFGGPVYLKEGRGRGKRTVKGYIALFVCFATKALHLELVGDLSSQSFLGALKRFISRRGHVANLYSDNGTNFVGARNELSELGEMLKSQKFERDVIDRLADRTVRWHFIPPHSPHHGGIWEAGIRSVKSHLKRVIGLTSLTYEEMHTVLTQIEACLNSRPLTPISNDPNDLIALSPSHFLIGDLLTAPVEHDVTPLPINRLSRWQYVEQLRQHFWKRWSVDYLTQLQPRRKWNQRLPNIEVGELAVIKEDNSPPLQWRLARVVRLHPGKDGCVRVVTLKTSKGEVTRSINKVCVLPMASMCS